MIPNQWYRDNDNPVLDNLKVAEKGISYNYHWNIESFEEVEKLMGKRAFDLVKWYGVDVEMISFYSQFPLNHKFF